jgi:hypothetical protein
MVKDGLYQIDTGYACFGIESKDGIIVFAAPIAAWAIGKSAEFVLSYYRDKKKATTILCKKSYPQ